MKTCDNKSVGVILQDGSRYVVIKRRNYPISYALVAGHCDGDSFEDAAHKEALEEVGASLEKLNRVFSETLENPCKRSGGSYHHWTVFAAPSWSGKLLAGSDAKELLLVTHEELRSLFKRTCSIARRIGVKHDDLSRITPAIVEDPEWKTAPGLEPVWAVILHKVGML